MPIAEFVMAHLGGLSFILFLCIVGLIARKRLQTYDTQIDGLSNTFNTQFEGLDYSLISSSDIKFREITRKGTVTGNGGVVRIIGNEFAKGYDFIHSSYAEPGYSSPVHVHKAASEFFYVLRGKIQVKEYDKMSAEELEPVRIITLAPGEEYLVKRGVVHSVSILDKTELIVIAKPPLFKRAGSLYERIFKR